MGDAEDVEVGEGGNGMSAGSEEARPLGTLRGMDIIIDVPGCERGGAW